MPRPIRPKIVPKPIAAAIAATVEQPPPEQSENSAPAALQFDGNSLGAFVGMTPAPIRADVLARSASCATPIIANAPPWSPAIVAYQAALDAILGAGALILEQQARNESTADAHDALEAAISAASSLRHAAELDARRLAREQKHAREQSAATA